MGMLQKLFCKKETSLLPEKPQSSLPSKTWINPLTIISKPISINMDYQTVYEKPVKKVLALSSTKYSQNERLAQLDIAFGGQQYRRDYDDILSIFQKPTNCLLQNFSSSGRTISLKFDRDVSYSRLIHIPLYLSYQENGKNLTVYFSPMELPSMDYNNYSSRSRHPSPRPEITNYILYSSAKGGDFSSIRTSFTLQVSHALVDGTKLTPDMNTFPAQAVVDVIEIFNQLQEEKNKIYSQVLSLQVKEVFSELNEKETSFSVSKLSLDEKRSILIKELEKIKDAL